MARKSKISKAPLTMLRAWAVHALLYLSAILMGVFSLSFQVNNLNAVDSSLASGGSFAAFHVFSLWTIGFYAHTGIVIVLTLYRLVRRLLVEQPENERRREEQLDRILKELTELRAKE